MNDLVALRGRRGVTYERVSRSPGLLGVRAVSHELLKQGGREADRGGIAFDLLRCVVEGPRLNRQMRRIVTHTLNLSGEDSDLAKRQGDLQNELSIGEKAFAEAQRTSYLELAYVLATVRQSPCSDGGPDQDPGLSPERRKSLLTEAARHFAGLTAVHLELADADEAIVRAARDLQRLIPQGMRRRRRGWRQSPDVVLQDILSAITRIHYEAWAEAGGSARIPHLAPSLLLTYISSSGRNRADALEAMRVTMRTSPMDSWALPMEHQRMSPTPLRDPELAAIIGRSFSVLMAIAVVLEETNDWASIEEGGESIEEAAAAF